MLQIYSTSDHMVLRGTSHLSPSLAEIQVTSHRCQTLQMTSSKKAMSLRLVPPCRMEIVRVKGMYVRE